MVTDKGSTKEQNSQGKVLNLSDIISRTPNAVCERVGDQILLLDVRNDRWFSLNITASFVWERLDGKSSIGEIANLAINRFDTNNDKTLPEVLVFLNNLLKMGLIQVRRKVKTHDRK